MFCSLLKASGSSAEVPARVERINPTEDFPKSTATDPEVRKKLERPSPVRPWDSEEVLRELHRRAYYPRSSRNTAVADVREGVARWPKVLKACVEGGADLALSAFGAAVFYLQRSLIDEEILSMGIVKPYVPPEEGGAADISNNTSELRKISVQEEQRENGSDLISSFPKTSEGNTQISSNEKNVVAESQISHMSLDGTTLANLEILTNSHSNTTAGSLWSKINHAKSPHGSRLLRAWLLRPLFQKADIDRRADAVEELVSGGGAMAMDEARTALSRCGDMERLLSRVHSMGAGTAGHHPNGEMRSVGTFDTSGCYLIDLYFSTRLFFLFNAPNKSIAVRACHPLWRSSKYQKESWGI